MIALSPLRTPRCRRSEMADRSRRAIYEARAVASTLTVPRTIAEARARRAEAMARVLAPTRAL